MKYEVGKKYTLPCVLIQKFAIAILHSHVGDVSGEMHHHLNNQFIPEEFVKLYELELDQMHATGGDDFKIEEREIECIREITPVMAYRKEQVPGLLIIQKRMAGHKLGDDMICPHQGCDLTGQPIVKQGRASCVICPCHGLAWNVKTGSLVKRKFREGKPINMDGAVQPGELQEKLDETLADS